MGNGDLSIEVHQASGMIAAQLECDPKEALARMTIRANAMGYTLDQMARDVLDRVVRFND